MDHLPQTVPPLPVDRRKASRSARWTAGFIVALGFGFMGSALIDASGPASRAAGAGPAMAPPMTTDLHVPSAGHAQTPEVDQAVRDWAWETPGADRRPASRQDLEELWLAR